MHCNGTPARHSRPTVVETAGPSLRSRSDTILAISVCSTLQLNNKHVEAASRCTYLHINARGVPRGLRMSFAPFQPVQWRATNKNNSYCTYNLTHQSFTTSCAAATSWSAIHSGRQLALPGLCLHMRMSESRHHQHSAERCASRHPSPSLAPGPCSVQDTPCCQDNTFAARHSQETHPKSGSPLWVRV